MALVLDTGVIYAALDERDDDHERCAALLGGSEETLVVPSPVLVELDYWLRKNATIDVWLAFADDLQSSAYTLWPADAPIVLAAARLQSRFVDQRLGFVDAAVFCSCEALGERKVATLDHRHFGALRTAGGHALELLPG
jgi:predicted nucleic acid-binding protein